MIDLICLCLCMLLFDWNFSKSTCCCRFFHPISYNIPIFTNSLRLFYRLFFSQKLATIPRRQFSRMEWRTTFGPTRRTRLCSCLRYGKFSNISGNENITKGIKETPSHIFVIVRFYYDSFDVPRIDFIHFIKNLFLYWNRAEKKE